MKQTSARHQFTLQDHGYGASASRGLPVYVSAFTGTHCTYPGRDGQAELTWVAASHYDEVLPIGMRLKDINY